MLGELAWRGFCFYFLPPYFLFLYLGWGCYFGVLREGNLFRFFSFFSFLELPIRLESLGRVSL